MFWQVLKGRAVLSKTLDNLERLVELMNVVLHVRSNATPLKVRVKLSGSSAVVKPVCMEGAEDEGTV